MTPIRRLTIVILAVAAVGDIIGVPFMIAANHHRANSVPTMAILASGIIAVLTLAGAAGLARAVRGAWLLSLVIRIIDAINCALGVGNHPTAATTVGGAVLLVLSIVAIVLLARVRREPGGLPGQPVRHAATRV
jgi:hypothetical protein